MGFLTHSFFYRRNIIKLRSLFIFILIPILIILPWTVRNYIVHKKLIFVRTGIGLNLYLANNLDATGTVFLKINGKVPKNFNEGISHHFKDMVLNEWIPNKYTEIEEDDYLFNKAIKFVNENPWKFTKLLFVKFYYFWWKNPFQDDPNIVYRIEYTLILFFSFIAFIRYRFTRQFFNLIFIFLITYSLFFALMGAMFNWKYRLIIEPLLIFLSTNLIFNRPQI